MDINKLSIDTFNKLAVEYQRKFMNVAAYHDTLDLFCNSIANHQAHILELGCGPGNVTRYVLSQRPDFRLLGIDLAPNMLQLAQANNPSAQFQLLDCRAIRQLPMTFDALLCGFCLPYLSKAEAVQLIADAAALLNLGGVLYLSSMEDDYSKSGLQTSNTGNQMHIYYHQADYLLEALKKNNFILLHIKHQPYPNDEEKITTDLILLAEKQY